MDLSKIKTLIDFVGKSDIAELTVTEKDTTVKIFRAGGAGERNPDQVSAGSLSAKLPSVSDSAPDIKSTSVVAPIFGLLHAAPAPGERAFVKLDDMVEAGQTLFIVEAMKVFNTISAPCAGRIVRLSAVDGGEVEAGDMLAEIA